MEPADFVEVDLSQYAEVLRNAGVSQAKANEFLAELGLRQEISRYLQEVAKTIAEGGEVSMEEIQSGINKIALDSYGIEYGIPLPSTADVHRPMIMVRGTPLAYLGLDNLREFQAELLLAKIPVRNSWIRMRDIEVCVVDTKEGPMAWPRYLAGTRMRKMIDSLRIRAGAQAAERELRAMESLKPRLHGGQWDSYVLNGAFPERSNRSGLVYLFRKGFPTLAMSWRGRYEKEGGRVIAALCMHPYGYYYGTFTGLMCPTDEVIAHLLMMRADEHRFWKSSGQWPAWDTRSGL
jgi:hypothetical protein